MLKTTVLNVFTLSMMLFLSAFIILLAVQSVAFSTNFYFKQYRLLKIGLNAGVSLTEYQQLSQLLWDYYLGRNNSPQYLTVTIHGDQKLYKDHELAHLADVKHLFQLGLHLRNLAAIMVASSIVVITLVEPAKAVTLIGKAVTTACACTATILTLLLTTIWLNFDKAFTYFHHLSFNNLLWQLDPAKDNLIKLFPEQFFFNAAMAIYFRSIVVLIAIGSISIFYNRYSAKFRSS